MNEIEKIIDDLKKNLTLPGRSAVFHEWKELSSDHIIKKSDPENFTEVNLIEPILKELKIRVITTNLQFVTPSGKRKVDYLLENDNGDEFLLEAKPIYSNLRDKKDDGAVNQIKGIFTLKDSQSYNFGVASDGLRWIIINNNGQEIGDFNIQNNFNEVKEILTGEKKTYHYEEEISKKFYKWYNALLHGGEYKNQKNKVSHINERDCLINNILHLDYPQDAENIAQAIIDRLIFIKFLQSKNIIKKDVIEYIYSLEEHTLNENLKQLFFNVLNTPINERDEVNPKFKSIPYLNGGLFIKTEYENRNPEYRIKADILKQILIFLDNFKFFHVEHDKQEDILNPEILGYIFEKAMTSKDRKGTGSYYTSKYITRYLAENTIYPFIIKKTNNYLKSKNLPQINSIIDLYKIKKNLLWEIREKVIYYITICDSACGSGAFLLAAANVLWEIHKKLKDITNSTYTDTWMKKHILKNNLFGVDINQNAVEIAKLRLWLWLVDSYEPEKIEPLPNIDYNILKGNSLIGYIDISKFRKEKNSVVDHIDSLQSLFINLKKREEYIKEYKSSYGNQTKEIKNKIQDYDRRISILLNIQFLNDIKKNKIHIENEDLQKLNPIHYGAEFYEIFDPNKDQQERGFDIIISNPPWEIWKPFEKEFFSRYDSRLTKYGVDKIEAKKIIDDLLKRQDVRNSWEEYKKVIEIQGEYFKKSGNFKNQSSMIEGKNISGDLNLCKLFTEHFFNLLNINGHAGIVIPSGFYTDAGTKGLRELIFDKTTVNSLFCFENKYGIFDGVHRSFKFIVLTFEKGGKTDNFKAAFMLHDPKILERRIEKKAINIDWNLIKKLSPTSYSILEFKNPQDVEIVKKLYQHPLLGQYIKNSWKFKLSNDFHMTNDSNIFLSSNKGIILYEGKMIEQYINTFEKPRYWVGEKSARNKDYKEYRLGFRAVASSTNRRSMIATIIPKNSFCGNSILATKIFENNTKIIENDDLLYLCAILNSFIIDYLLRLKITTNLNMFFIYELPVPHLDKNDNLYKNIVSLAGKLICTSKEFEDLKKEIKFTKSFASKEDKIKLRAKIDILVSKLYDITKDELTYILECFKSQENDLGKEMEEIKKEILSQDW